MYDFTLVCAVSSSRNVDYSRIDDPVLTKRHDAPIAVAV